jgi:hypothetical protein
MQMVCFGLEDYRGQAEVTVVFGGSAGDRPEDVTARVKAAAGFYRADSAKIESLLLLSGRSTEEVNAMRALAIAQKIPEEAVRVDPLGVDTESAVRGTHLMLTKLFPEHRPVVRVVGHFYELPRIQMRYWREGREVLLTVPMPESLGAASHGMVREIGSLWKYYFESIVKP